MGCVACNNPEELLFVKSGVEYYQCTSCKTVFSGELDNSGKVGGWEEGVEELRNKMENPIRIQRVLDFAAGEKEAIHLLDFGCGKGMFVDDLHAAGISADGFDYYNPDFNNVTPEKWYNVVTMIEVIEHLTTPFPQLDHINSFMTRGGYIMIETSFVDVAIAEGIPLQDFHYIEPRAGHSTIFSHHGLDVLMCLHGFVPVKHINRNVRVYRKR